MKKEHSFESFAIWFMIIIVIIMTILAIFAVIDYAKSERYSPEEDPDLHLMYVICQPDDYICVRSKPNRKSHEEGYLLCGFSVYVSDKVKNGYIYSPDLNTESGEGWIFAGYLIDDEPQIMDEAPYKVVSNARVAARKYIDGPRRSWLKNGDEVKVYYFSEEWCVTNKGFIMTKYLEPEEE